MLHGDELGQVLRVGCDDNDAGDSSPQGKSLSGEHNINIDGFGLGCWAAHLSRLSPQFRGQAERCIGEWQVPSWDRIYEGIKLSDPGRFPRPKEFPLQLVIS